MLKIGLGLIFFLVGGGLSRLASSRSRVSRAQWPSAGGADQIPGQVELEATRREQKPGGLGRICSRDGWCGSKTSATRPQVLVHGLHVPIGCQFDLFLTHQMEIKAIKSWGRRSLVDLAPQHILASPKRVPAGGGGGLSHMFFCLNWVVWAKGQSLVSRSLGCHCQTGPIFFVFS